ncbi:MAG TPA: ParB/RepB/Spo0J family partition protein [Ktedonosporobacter sp.]|nr:ParB/RepB/Spo0J family partition protein [Ktedonosporobacter sp.]
MTPCHLCQTTSSLSYRDMYIIENSKAGLVSEQTYTICYSCQRSSTNLLDPESHNTYLAGLAVARKNLPDEQQPELIAIDLLHDNPYQSRGSMDEDHLLQLAETIASQGFQGVLIARPHPQISGSYQLTAGHRRRDAALLADLTTLPVIVRSLSDSEMATLAATENLQREDLTPLDEGRLFRRMIDELDLNLAEVVRAVKKHRNYVLYRLRLAQAPQDIQDFVVSKPDSLRAVIHLLDIDDPAERAQVFELLRQKVLLTDDLPAYTEEIRQRQRELASPADQSGDVSSASALLASEPLFDGEEISLPSSPPEPITSATRSVILTAQQIRQRRLKASLRLFNQFTKAISAPDPLLTHERAMLARMIESAQALLADAS